MMTIGMGPWQPAADPLEKLDRYKFEAKKIA
jgi:hypothetical protein